MLWGCVEPEKQMKSSLQHEHCNEAQPAWRIGREPRTVYCTSGHLSNGDGVDSLAMDGLITLRIAHLRIAPWWAILRWAILSTLVIRIAHPNYHVVYALFANDMAIE